MMQPVVAQQSYEAFVPVEQPVYYEEQPQYVELVEQPVQYVEQYEAQPEQYFAPPQKQMVVKSAPPQQYEPQYAVQPVKYVKSGPPPVQYEQFIQEDNYFDEIEPTETDFGYADDLDEGTVNARVNREPAPVITGDRLAKKENVKPKVVKNSFQNRKTVKNTSPRITTMPTKTASTIQQFEQEGEFSQDDW